MKKLVALRDLEEIKRQGKTVCQVDGDTLITPAARDFAQESGITFSSRLDSPACCDSTGKEASGSHQGIDSELIYKALKTMMEKGLLKDAANSASDRKYTAERDDKGLKLVRGNSVKMDCFDWHLTYEEIDYVIEGTLTVAVNGKTFTAKAGDILFVPSGSQVVWGSPDQAKIFYSTYPANWADLS